MQKLIFTVALLIGILTVMSGQSDLSATLWVQKAEKSFISPGNRLIQPNEYTTLELNEDNLHALLATAPPEGTKSVDESETILPVPLSDGTVEEFQIVEYSMVEPGFAAKYPEIKTYYGRGVKNPLHRIRLDWTAVGLRAMMILSEGMAFIDPYAQGDTKHYVSYFKKDYPLPVEPFVCGTEHEAVEVNDATAQVKAGDCQFRSYRLAMATTGEYSNFFGATSAAQSNLVAAEVVTSINRVNEVYERDIAVRLILIANTDLVFYYDGATDPFTNNSGSAMLNENRDNMNAVIGSANFDVGHVYSTGGGGIAQLNSPCGTGKARGVTGLGNPTGDPFYIDYVAHELGHQFGGRHTFNGTTGSCGGNIGTTTSVEPGSGTTIMAYAGICAPQNVQNNSDPYFHGISISEFGAFVTGAGNTCATIIASPNSPPTADAGADYTIPASTPFVLTATSTDPDAGDVLTYCWEQIDTEIAPTAPPQPVNAVGPMFRSLDPVTSPSRYFPMLSSVVNNTSTDWETLPAVARDMEFRVSVRDNSTNAAGCTAESTMTVTTAVIAGSFAVTAPTATGITWEEGTTQTVTWDVATTNLAPISCANVDIRLSYDGGFTYPVTLEADTPNDGSQDIVVPVGTTTQARVMVFCSDNIFYDISNNDFTITTGAPNFTLSLDPTEQSVCGGDDAVFNVNTASINGFTGNVSLTASNVPAGANVSFGSNNVNAGSSSVATVSGTENVPTGTYVITISANGTPATRTADFTLTVIGAVPLSSPADGASDQPVRPDYTWNAVAGVTGYQIQVATDAGFNNIVTDRVVNGTMTSQEDALDIVTTYYWRMRSSAPCAGPWSATRSFSTDNCLSMINATPQNISASGTPTVNSVTPVSRTETIQSVTIPNMTGTHTWMEDLDVSLIGKDGTEIVLFNDLCTDTDNFDIGFDDAALQPVSAAPCGPLGGGGVFQPVGSLANLNGLTADGNWTLRITDDTNQDGGSLQQWTLNLCVNAVLPVDMLSFEAKAQKNDIRLDWITAAEINNAGYNVERRAEYERDFSTIGTVAAAEVPAERNLYDFTDKEVKAGVNYFYRVRQYDFDGSNALSEVRSARLAETEAAFSVYPNPVKNTLFGRVNREEAGQTRARLYDVQGRLLREMTFEGVSFSISTEELPAGFYSLELQNGSVSQIEKVIVE